MEGGGHSACNFPTPRASAPRPSDLIGTGVGSLRTAVGLGSSQQERDSWSSFMVPFSLHDASRCSDCSLRSQLFQYKENTPESPFTHCLNTVLWARQQIKLGFRRPCQRAESSSLNSFLKDQQTVPPSSPHLCTASFLLPARNPREGETKSPSLSSLLTAPPGLL